MGMSVRNVQAGVVNQHKSSITSQTQNEPVQSSLQPNKPNADSFVREPNNELQTRLDEYAKELKKKKPHITPKELAAKVEAKKNFLLKLQNGGGSVPINNRNSRRQALIEGMTDPQHNGASNFAEHLETLSPEKRQKEINEMHSHKQDKPYVSSKNKKQQKKDKERQSNLEHQKERLANTKLNRDRIYCTQNGIMNKAARKAYNRTVAEMNARAKDFKPFAPENSFANKSAKDSVDIFIKHFESSKNAENSKITINQETSSREIASEGKDIPKKMGKGKIASIVAGVALVAGTVYAYLNRNKNEDATKISA